MAAREEGSGSTEVAFSDWKALLIASRRVWQAISRDLHTVGIAGLAEYEVLLALGQAGREGLRSTDLALALQTSKSRVNRLVNQMEESEYVVRVPSFQDRRSAQVVLTENGRAALRLANPCFAWSLRSRFSSKLQSCPGELSVILGRLSQVEEPPALESLVQSY